MKKYVGAEGVQSIKEWSAGKFAGNDHSHAVATTEESGLMSAEDKAWIEEQKTGGGSDGDFLTDEEFLAAVIS